MEKTFGAQERHDQLIVYGKGQKAVLIYGYGEEDGQGYDWRHVFTHRPTKQEVLQTITDHIDSLTDQKILSGFIWEDNDGIERKVWLNDENQRNFSEAHRIAVMLGAKKYEPATFKISEDENKNAKYRTFETLSDLNDFYLSAFAYIKQTLDEGWIEKDAVAVWVESLEL